MESIVVQTHFQKQEGNLMRYLFTFVIVILMTCLPEKALAQTPSGQPDFRQTSDYFMFSGYRDDYLAAKANWESIKDDPNMSSFQKDAAAGQMNTAKEGLAKLCNRNDFGPACLTIASAERGTIGGYIYAERACYADEDDGCILAAIMLAEGEGRRKDPIQAENILKNNCGPDRLPVCRAYATLLASDQGHPADLPKARETYMSFCAELDDLESCKSAFEFLNAGNPTPRVYFTNRLEITKKTCALDPENAIACNHAKDAKELLPLIDLAECRTSSSNSVCAGVATVLEQLAPENPNFKDRIMQLQAYSCETLRHEQSCQYLMKQDFTKDILAPHKSKAAGALQTVCLNSNTRERYIAEACQWSAQQGLALKSDEGYAEARPYVERFCLMHKPSCGTWARMLLEGLGGPLDLPKGREFMMGACAASNIDACLDSAMIINDGIGGEKDPEAAQALLKNICQKGEAKACEFLSELSQTQ
jgi:TPR repeat protein